MIMLKIRLFVNTLVYLMAVAAPMAAQTGNRTQALLYGRLGRVSGGAVAYEPITLNKKQTAYAEAFSTIIRTLPDGRFLFQNLDPGSYGVTVRGKEVSTFVWTGEPKLAINAPGPVYPDETQRQLAKVGLDLTKILSANPLTKVICLALEEALDEAGVLTVKVEALTLDRVPSEFLASNNIKVIGSH
jgi:hypothetical protein